MNDTNAQDIAASLADIAEALATDAGSGGKTDGALVQALIEGLAKLKITVQAPVVSPTPVQVNVAQQSWTSLKVEFDRGPIRGGPIIRMVITKV